MSSSLVFPRIPSLKTADDFRRHVASLGLDIPCEDTILPSPESPLAQPVAGIPVNGKIIGNRWAIQPMEGWDATTTGGVTDEVRRRWRRFGESGAKLIFGGEAMAVTPEARANPNQLIINEKNKSGLAALRELLISAHREYHGAADDLVVGFQLTHSGRFCKPHDHHRLEPRVAYRHPLLDPKFGVKSDLQVMSDGEVEQLVDKYAVAARIAWDVGADFVDIKHCHGYLLHEFLSAFTRPGRYGGSFENRTRPLREIVLAIRASGNKIDIAVRLSAFDSVPFRPDLALSKPGRPGPGVPEDFSRCLPYHYAFGVNPANPLEADLGESYRFMDLCAQLGVRILNLSAGSPYYNPHIQRPAAYPPSDAYQAPEDPLAGVARQLAAVRALKAKAPPGITLVGSAYTYLQEFLPLVAQRVVRDGWADMVGIGRMVLSYPGMIADTLQGGVLNPRLICRTFSDCTTAPRNGIVSGCYPLDKHYAARPEARLLKEIKKGGPTSEGS